MFPNYRLPHSGMIQHFVTRAPLAIGLIDLTCAAK